MIKLRNNPIEGSTVKVNLGFRDSAGMYYIPSQITYTLLALNNDKESWSVVDDIYRVPITPASTVNLTIPDIKTISGTTLNRKIMVYWEAFVDNTYSDFVDEIIFDVTPKPYVPNEPVNPPIPPQVYVEINSVQLQIGSLTLAPINPVFIVKTSLPVNIDNATAVITNTVTGDTIDCSIGVDNVGATLTVNPDIEIAYRTSYELKLSGLVSTINSYTMKEDFITTFVTEDEYIPHIPVIQNSKEVVYNENGEFTVEPDNGFDGIAVVNVTVDTPKPKEEQAKEITVTKNGVTTVEPDSGKVLSSVTVNTNVPITPDIQEKEVTIIDNNSTEIVEPDAGYLLNKVTVNTAIPVDTTKNVSIDVKEYTDPVNITPDSGFESMEGAVVTLTNFPEAETKSVTITENGTVTITPDTKDYLSSVEVTTDIPLEDNKTETFTTNGEYEIVPTTGNAAMKKATVTVAVPLEDNKEETINLEDYSAPVEITPSTGNEGMKKATVTLTNMTRLYVWKDANATPNPHYMYTTYSNTSRCDGHAYQCGTTKNALLTSKNVEVNGEALYVSGYPNSLYYRDPDNDMGF